MLLLILSISIPSMALYQIEINVECITTVTDCKTEKSDNLPVPKINFVTCIIVSFANPSLDCVINKYNGVVLSSYIIFLL